MKNETAIITGSTSGIGKQIAETFLKEGCKVTISSRNEKNVEKSLTEFKKKYGDSVIGVPCDVSDLNALKTLMKATLDNFGSIRILVANAGVNLSYGPLEYINPKEAESNAQKVIGTNLIGLINTITTVYPYMIQQNYGRIITLSGGGADRPVTHMTIYSASKGGVVAFSKCFAEELKESHPGIKINIFQPGMIDTNLNKNVKLVEGWKDQKVFQEETSLIYQYIGADIEKSCSKVIPYVLPSCKSNGKSFRGFSIVKMIRGGRKYQKAMKKS